MKVVEATPFFTPAEIDYLQTNVAHADSHWDRRRQQACGLIQSVAGRIGFPQRTASTAQLLYHRFHLFYSPSDFVTHEVALACLAVAAKVNDTPKKSREIILTSYALRYPELARTPAIATAAAVAAAAASKSGAAKASDTSTDSASMTLHPPSFAALSVVSESDVDAGALEKERRRIVAVEALILQSVSFDMHMRPRTTLSLTLKIAKKWNIEKRLAFLAWKVASDIHRTYAPLCYPPSTLALACLYTAALISPLDTASLSIVTHFQPTGVEREWEKQLRAKVEDVEEVVHTLLDLYTTTAVTLPTVAGGAPSSTGITPISPATPASPSDAATLAAASLLDGPADSNSGRATPSSMKKHVSSQSYAPPPFGLVAYLAHLFPSPSAGSLPPSSSSDVISELTQIKIRLRSLEDERRKEDVAILDAVISADTDNGDEKQMRARRRNVELPGLLRHCRPLDTGGIDAQATLKTPAASISSSTLTSSPNNADIHSEAAAAFGNKRAEVFEATSASQQLEKERTAHLTRFLF